MDIFIFQILPEFQFSDELWEGYSWQERMESIWAQSSALAGSINGQIPEEAKGGLLEEVIIDYILFKIYEVSINQVGIKESGLVLLIEFS